MPRSKRHRTLMRAVRAWQAGRPHQAWEILDQAGMGEVWPEFKRVALDQARQRYVKLTASWRRS